MDQDSMYPPPPSSDSSFVKVLFTSASASDWFSFLGVLVLSTMLCACCIGVTGFCCIHHQRTKTRIEIMKYKQTQDDSDTDIDELQGMMHQLNGMDADHEPSISHPASIVNHIIGRTRNINGSISRPKEPNVANRISALNRARSLKDSVKRHVSKSSLFGSHSKRDQLPNSKITHSVHSQSDRMSHSHSNPPHSNPTHSVRSALSASGLSSLSPPQSMRSNPHAIDHSVGGIAGSTPSTVSAKSIAIHPALSSAIETVQEMSALKADRARHHGLVVASTIIEADTESESESESESSPSGIDLSEEFIRIEDDVSIDVQDLHDLNEMEEKQKRQQSASKRHQHKKYSSIGYIDDDSTENEESEEEELSVSHSQHRRAGQMFGIRVLSEERRQYRRGPRKETTQKVSSEESEDEEEEQNEEEEEESDNVSELSEEQTLQSIAAASFSQDI